MKTYLVPVKKYIKNNTIEEYKNKGINISSGWTLKEVITYYLGGMEALRKAWREGACKGWAYMF